MLLRGKALRKGYWLGDVRLLDRGARKERLQTEHHCVDQRGGAAPTADQRHRGQARALPLTRGWLARRGEEHESIRQDVTRPFPTIRTRARVRGLRLERALDDGLLFGRPHVA